MAAAQRSRTPRSQSTDRDALSPRARALCDWLGARGWDFRRAAQDRGVRPAELYREWLESLGWNQSLAARLYRRPGTNEPVTRQAIEAQMKTFGVMRPLDLPRMLAGQSVDGGVSALRDVHDFISNETSRERLCCEQLLELARTYQELLDHERARSTLVEVVELARRISAPDLVARAIHPFTYSAFQTKRFGSYNRDVVDQLDEWIAVLRTQGRSEPTALALAHLGFELFVSPNAEDRKRGQAASSEALAIAERSGDKMTQALVVAFRSLSLSGPDHLEARLELVLPHVEHTAEYEPNVAYVVLHTALNDLLESARFEEAEEAVEGLRNLEKLVSAPWPERYRAALATARGSWEEARRLSTLRPGVPLDSAAQVLGLLQYESLLLRGDWEDLESLARWNANMNSGRIGFEIAKARVLSIMGRSAEVLEDFERWAADGFAVVPRDFVYIANLVGLAEIGHELDDSEAAKVLYGLLAPYRTRLNVIRVVATVRGPVAHTLGRLATTFGDFAAAREDFRIGRDVAQRAGLRPWVAWIDFDHARMLLREGKPESRRRIGELATDASRLARELEMSWLAHRAQGLAASVH